MNWYERLLQKKRKYEEQLLIRQRDILFQWIETKETPFDGGVIVASSYSVSFFSFSEGRWRKVQQEKSDSHKSLERFILCSQGGFRKLSSEFSLNHKQWVNIFSAPTFEVWERAAFYREQGRVPPLRLGLSHNEKSQMTREVRHMIEDVLRGKQPFLSSNFSSRIEESQALDVAVWVDGRLRASVIMIGLSCREALQVGSRRATEDKRFPPLKLEEIESMRIEITLMSDLIFPVLESDLEKDRIDPTKGFVALLQDKRGWYLPAVHNVVSFSSLRNFLTRLATEKAGIVPSKVRGTSYGQFAVIDWIENGETILPLSGPTEMGTKGGLLAGEGERVLKQAVDWLCQLQTMTGNLPAICNAKGVVKEVGLPALGCTGHALALYGKTYDDTQALQTAEKIWQYLHEQIVSEKKEDSTYFFAIVYFLRLSLLVNKGLDASLKVKLIEHLNSFHTIPILWLQTLSFLVEYEQVGHREYAPLLRDETAKAVKRFEQHQASQEQIALYPELIAVLHELWTMTKEERWYREALKQIAWYGEMQQTNGTFPYTLSDTFAYTRGTGKVFEALACFPEEAREMLEKSFAWLQAMQYTQENTFFLNKMEQRILVGGFRHDAFNRETWIDASAHIILGLTRLRVGL